MLSIIYIHFILFLSYWEIQFQYKNLLFVYVINYKQEKLKKT